MRAIQGYTCAYTHMTIWLRACDRYGFPPSDDEGLDDDVRDFEGPARADDSGGAGGRGGGGDEDYSAATTVMGVAGAHNNDSSINDRENSDTGSRSSSDSGNIAEEDGETFETFAI
jgi:hypothetical protein